MSDLQSQLDLAERIRQRWTERIDIIYPGDTVARQTAQNEILDLLDTIAALKAQRATVPESAALPCPFCGQIPELGENGDNSPNWYVQCGDWKCCHLEGQYLTKESAIAAWNRRAQPVAPTPRWEDAPEWAMWWAVNADGYAYWYLREPNLPDITKLEGPFWTFSDICSVVGYVPIPLGIDWRTLKAKRPEGEAPHAAYP